LWQTLIHLAFLASAMAIAASSAVFFPVRNAAAGSQKTERPLPIDLLGDS